jgi:hypothetical protein
MIVSDCHHERVYCPWEGWVCSVCHMPCGTLSVLDLARKWMDDTRGKAKVEKFASGT